MIQAKEFCEQYEQHEGSIVKPRGFITKIPVDDIADLIRTVAAEARGKGIEEMLDAALNAYYDCDCEKDPDVVMKAEAARLKEKP